MKPEVREFIKQAGLSRSTVAQMAAMLPDDDLELDSWISEAIRESNSMAFHLIVFAALSRERPVDARHLSTGAKLAGGSYYIAAMAFRVHGEMPEYLLEGLRNTAIQVETHAMALATIVLWCDERRGGVYPDQLIPEARILARRGRQKLEVGAFLIEIAIRAKDAVLEQLVREHYPKGPDARWQKVVTEAGNFVQKSIEQARRPLMTTLPETPVYGGEGGTVRRAVPRVGRNDPCHCGSGKKYKHCHFSFAAPFLCDASAGGRSESAHHPGKPRPRQRTDNPNLHAPDRRSARVHDGPAERTHEGALIPRSSCWRWPRLSASTVRRISGNMEAR